MAQRGQRHPLRDGWRNGRPQMIEDAIAVLFGDRFAEQDHVRRLPVDGDDRRIGGRHQHELRPELVADELTERVRLRRLRLNGEHTADFSLCVQRHPEVLPCGPCRSRSRPASAGPCDEMTVFAIDMPRMFVDRQRR